MANSNSSNQQAGAVVVDAEEEEENESNVQIDNEQLSEYEEMIEQLGSFPDKVSINFLTMVADDYSFSPNSAKAIYDIIKKHLLLNAAATTTIDVVPSSTSSSVENILPLVYVLDSILKNAKGNQYITIVEKDAVNWLPVISNKLREENSNQQQLMMRTKLHKVWKTWGEFNIFSLDSLKVMSRGCFDDNNSASGGASGGASAVVDGGGASTIGSGDDTINRAKDGSLLLPTDLRGKMQCILDEIQNDVPVLERVSLERLANLNPELLITIKRTAIEQEDNKTTNANKMQVDESAKQPASNMPSFLVETRSQVQLDRSKAWDDLDWWTKNKGITECTDIINKLKQRVVDDAEGGSSSASAGDKQPRLYTQQGAIDMTQYLASVSATANLLSNALDKVQKQQQAANDPSASAILNNLFGQAGASAVSSITIDKSLFTNDGIKVKDDNIIGALYEIGLPFISSVDGVRFKSQIELSNHLDALFKRNQLEKSMARTEERGWYVSDLVWVTCGTSDDDQKKDASGEGAEGATAAESDSDPQASGTVPADETRERCVVCGMTFKMEVGNDKDGDYEGQYVYRNCREIRVYNENEAAEQDHDDLLVHVTCWRGLGSPETITSDQALQDTLRF